MERRFWLFKSEPTCFSFNDLKNCPDGTDSWDGVRNYQARNFLRDEVHRGDGVLFYHSNIAEPVIVGIARVVRPGYPDLSALDPRAAHHDPRASEADPIWYAVDVQYVTPLPRALTREALKREPDLTGMELLKKGSRLSVQPVTPEQWHAILMLGGLTADPSGLNKE